MTNTIKTKNGKVNTLTPKCIIELHKLLSDNYLIFHDMEPISPEGVKNNNMLESAVHRQNAGIDDYYKYSTSYENCATLAYGIIKNHAFHNGNKRAGLLAIIKHLNVNGSVLRTELGETELYQLLVCTAKSDLKSHSLIYCKDFDLNVKENWDDDDSVEYISFWLRKNSMPKKLYVGNNIKIKTLKKILSLHNIDYSEEGRYIVLRIIEEKKFLGLIKYDDVVKVSKRYHIGKHKEKVKKSIIDKIRKDFNLTRSHGVDNVSFYDEENVLDEEIKKYKSIIYRLSKT